MPHTGAAPPSRPARVLSDDDLEPTDDPDKSLMLRVREGDREAFRTLYDKYSRAVARFAANFTGIPARGDELAQEVFLQVYRARDRYEPRAKFSTWLYTIAHNLCLNEVRRFDYRGRIEPLERPDDESGGTRALDLADPSAVDGEAATSGNELAARLRHLVAGLPESQRTALILSRVDELRYQEIGEILDCSEQAVKSLIFRATRTLKEGLREYVGAA
jgi:RNA polymerase sigma-70 factor (ECF subfamily)